MSLNDPDGRRLKVNRAFCEMLGYSEQELLDVGALSVSHPDDRNRVYDRLRQLVASQASSDRGEFRYLHKDGSVVWADVSATVVRKQDGSPRYLVSQIEDITGRRL